MEIAPLESSEGISLYQNFYEFVISKTQLQDSNRDQQIKESCL